MSSDPGTDLPRRKFVLLSSERLRPVTVPDRRRLRRRYFRLLSARLRLRHIHRRRLFDDDEPLHGRQGHQRLHGHRRLTRRQHRSRRRPARVPGTGRHRRTDPTGLRHRLQVDRRSDSDTGRRRRGGARSRCGSGVAGGRRIGGDRCGDDVTSPGESGRLASFVDRLLSHIQQRRNVSAVYR